MRTTKTLAENKELHRKVVDIIKQYLLDNDFVVENSDHNSYTFKVNGKKCKVFAHQNINNSVIIEYATDKYNMLDNGYEEILYMDITNPKRNKFYMAPVTSVAEAINNRLGKSQYYFYLSRKDVFANSGICVGIAENVFERINGVQTFNI